MKKSLFLLFVFCAILVKLTAITYVTSSTVSGLWEQSLSPYYIMNDVTIPEGAILTIEPGVEVFGNGMYALNVNGALRAIGTEQDSIIFTAADTTVGWHGLHFNQVASEPDSSIIKYCKITYGKANSSSNNGGGITINRNKIEIAHSFISRCSATGGGAISCFNSSDVIIRANVIYKNSASFLGGGIFLSGSNSIEINHNIISNNFALDGGGLAITGNNEIESNVIVNNRTANSINGALYINSGQSLVLKNTICNNYGIGLKNRINYAYPIVMNCIIWGNTSQTNATSLVSFCDIQDGMMNQNPMFVSPSSGIGSSYDGLDADWHISYDSPCVDAGDPTLPLDADGTRSDIGCYPYLHKAWFVPEPMYVTVGDIVDFTNQSMGYDLPEAIIEWDLGNDGTVDSTSYNWSHQFNTPGVYAIKLKQRIGVLADSCLQYVVVQQNQLPPPENVQVFNQGNNMGVAWDAVTETTSHVPVNVHYYVVLYSDTPYGTFRYLGTSAYNSTSYIHINAAANTTGFYKVIGFDGNDREMQEFIKLLKR